MSDKDLQIKDMMISQLQEETQKLKTENEKLKKENQSSRDAIAKLSTQLATVMMGSGPK